MKKTALKRTVPLKRSGRINPVSKRRRARDKDYQQARIALRERAQGRCEVQAVPTCWRVMSLSDGHAHHVAGRLGADPHRLENMLFACRPCHQHLHSHVAESYERGWLQKRVG